ncbi:histidine phosphatase family protein [Aureisphaera sp. CAU 1614]|uniref:Histidine phosphatase family protein n=1 Tax=Halomarinibacterium sedimenti TaxID=2857106 RepID=A0A9X1FP37_9FLAO|nr:phosphoglycerate mutase family protein [Halomarinibacterium sedimenti]MBW2938218.1 histidine phosphatase family protein [Halomarinibacterium sedimenti]
MRTLLLICFVFISTLSCKDEKKNEVIEDVEIVTTYYLIRHAEKDRSDSTNTNPALTAKGLERAKLWASYFDSIPLNRIYSTNYVRTQQTAKDVSEKKSLPIEPYEPKSLIADDFKEATKGNHILIVGHSNTTPMLVNKILGTNTYEDIPDDDNSRLYVVTIEGDNKKCEIRKVEL